jgi:hypothetical protein
VHCTDTAAVRAHLKDDGVCVVKGCFSEAEVEQAMDNVWSFVEGQGTGVDRHDVRTWTNDRWQPRTALVPEKLAGGGLHDGRGVHQSEASWYIRSRPKLKQLWASIYGTDDLVCSFDGLVLCRPWGVDPSWRVKANGLHLDGGTARFGLHPVSGAPMTPEETGMSTDSYHYVQGVVNLVTTTPESGGFTCVLGSHRAFATLEGEYWREQQSANTTKRIVSEHPEVYAGKHIVPHMEAGDVVVWDDRMIHNNSPGVSGRVPDTLDGLIRVAQLCTMAPASHSSPPVLAARRACVTGRWPGGFAGGWCGHRVPTYGTLSGGGVPARFRDQPRAELDETALSLICGTHPDRCLGAEEIPAQALVGGIFRPAMPAKGEFPDLDDPLLSFCARWRASLEKPWTPPGHYLVAQKLNTIGVETVAELAAVVGADGAGVELNARLRAVKKLAMKRNTLAVAAKQLAQEGFFSE